MTDDDQRIAAFCDPSGPEVFSAIAYAHQVWERDPLDVHEVHANARAVFARLVDRASTPIRQDNGRFLLIRGESGAGKTHLMRAFRSLLHGNRLGYAAYMQMSSRTDDYARLLLVNVIDSLERAYDPPDEERSGLICLSNGVLETPLCITSEEAEELRDGDLDKEALGDLARQMVDRILREDLFGSFDPDLLQVLLFLQRHDPAIRARALKYLRCEPLSAHEQRLLGDVSPKTRPGDPERMLEQLGKLMWSATSASMVLLIDQLEDIYNQAEAAIMFPRLVDSLRRVVDQIPSAIVVISCLDDFYVHLRTHLTKSSLDRIETEPEPVILVSNRTQDEVESIVARRLSVLYDAREIAGNGEDPIYPFRHEQLGDLVGLRTRDVLAWCRATREASIAAGRWTAVGPVEPDPSSDAEHGVVELERSWLDFRATERADVPDDAPALLRLIEEAARACATELGSGYQFTSTRADDGLEIQARVQGATRAPVFVTVCNKGPQGGALGRQIDQLRAAAGHRTPVAVRCSEFPRAGKRTRLVEQLGELIRGGGRKVVVEDADWRLMMLFPRFLVRSSGHPHVTRWLEKERPLGQLRCLRLLLDLEDLEQAHDRASSGAARTASAEPLAAEPLVAAEEAARAATFAHQEPRSPTVADASAVVQHARPAVLSRAREIDSPPRVPPERRRVQIGVTRDLAERVVELEPDDFTTHAAFLGSTGSGKTTLALSVIEQLVDMGVSAILVDRKGDLCRYGSPQWWAQQPSDPARAARKQHLRERVHVNLFTPGEPSGRQLLIPVIPGGLGDLPSTERAKLSQYASNALAAMMGLKDTRSDRPKRVILAKAIELLAALRDDRDATMGELIDVIHRQDGALLNAIGRLESKHFAPLVEALETLRHQRKLLLTGDGDTLSIDALLSPVSSRAQLSIISTKFLGDAETIEFWVARLLIELSRWASRNSKPALQAVVMFDEADIYLPAARKPATKDAMLDLLRRARSAGLGVFLATQSPGDLDYRARDNILSWFLGRIAEDRAIAKVEGALGDSFHLKKKLPAQKVGQFIHVREASGLELSARPSLLETAQMTEEEILSAARASAGETRQGG